MKLVIPLATIEKVAGPCQGLSTSAHSREEVELSGGHLGQVLPSTTWDLQEGGGRGRRERTWVMRKWVPPFLSRVLGYSGAVGLGSHSFHDSHSWEQRTRSANSISGHSSRRSAPLGDSPTLCCFLALTQPLELLRASLMPTSACAPGI